MLTPWLLADRRVPALRLIRRMRCLGSILALTAIAPLLLTSCATSGPTESGPAIDSVGLDQVLAAAREEFGFPGAIAGVWSPTETWVGTVGTAGAAGDEVITPAHHTRIGSVTKTFTGTVLLQEVEKGTMSLDDVIEQYVPGLPNGTTATLRDLAQMTSGIPSYTLQMPFLLDHYEDVDRVFTAEQLMDYVRGEAALFEPGATFDYSNTNTVALGMAIEKATGRALDVVFRDQILEPLGLTATSWPGESAELPTPYLSGQTDEGLPEGTLKDATSWNPSWANAAGEMISTLDDLRVWGRALGTGEGILGEETHALRVASFEDNLSIEGNDPDGVYGLGAGLIDGWIGHTGELAGYNTSVLYDPVTQTTVVVVVNSNIVNAEGQSPAPTISERLRAVLSGA